jgi:integrase
VARTAQHQAKPLLREDIFVVLKAMGDRIKDRRDKALLLLGFTVGLRRSEAAAAGPTSSDFRL